MSSLWQQLNEEIQQNNISNNDKIDYSSNNSENQNYKKLINLNSPSQIIRDFKLDFTSYLKQNSNVSFKNSSDRRTLLRNVRIQSQQRTYLQIQMISEMLQKTEFYKFYQKQFEENPQILQDISRKVQTTHFRGMDIPLGIFQQSNYIFIIVQGIFYSVIDRNYAQSFWEGREEEKDPQVGYRKKQVISAFQTQDAYNEQFYPKEFSPMNNGESTPNISESKSYRNFGQNTPRSRAQNSEKQSNRSSPKHRPQYTPRGGVNPIELNAEKNTNNHSSYQQNPNINHDIKHNSKQLTDYSNLEMIIKMQISEKIPECYFLKKLGPGDYFGDIPIRHKTYSHLSFICPRKSQVLLIDKNLFLTHFGTNHQMMQQIDTLKEAVFKSLKSTVIETLIDIAEEQQYFKDNIIISKNDQSKDIYFILDGEVKLGQIQKNTTIKNFILNSPRGQIQKINNLYSTHLNQSKENEQKQIQKTKKQKYFQFNNLVTDQTNQPTTEDMSNENSTQIVQQEKVYVSPQYKIQQNTANPLSLQQISLANDQVIKTSVVLGSGQYFGEKENEEQYYLYDVVVNSQKCKIINLSNKLFYQVTSIYGYHKSWFANLRINWRKQRLDNLNQTISSNLQTSGSEKHMNPLFETSSMSTIKTQKSLIQSYREKTQGYDEDQENDEDIARQFNELRKQQHNQIMKSNINIDGREIPTMTLRFQKTHYFEPSKQHKSMADINSNKTIFQNQAHDEKSNLMNKTVQSEINSNESQIKTQMIPLELSRKNSNFIVQQYKQQDIEIDTLNSPQMKEQTNSVIFENQNKEILHNLKQLCLYKALNVPQICQDTEKETQYLSIFNNIQTKMKTEMDNQKQLFMQIKDKRGKPEKFRIIETISTIQNELSIKLKEQQQRQNLDQQKWENLIYEYDSYNFQQLSI